MSTLRISNIEAKSVPASATIDEKVKITNSSGDPLVFIDGKTSGITTVGINTTDPNITFDANSNVVVTGIITATKFSGQFEPTSVGIADSIFHTGDTDTSINFSAADTITLDTAGSQRVRVDASGIVIVATGAARTYVDGAGNTQTPKVQIEDNSNSNTAIVLRYNSGAGAANRRASFMFARTADGSAVSNNSVLGEVLFMGEGNNNIEKAASIRAEVDGTPGTTDMPGRLIFSTTADGANTTTERLRITADGKVGINVTSPTTNLQIGDGTVDSDNVLKFGKRVSSNEGNLPLIGHHSHNGSASSLALSATSSSGCIHFFTGNDADGFGDGNNEERLRIDASGKVGINGASTNAILEVRASNTNHGITLIDASNSGGSPAFEIISKRSDGNVNTAFSSNIFLGTNRTDQKVANGKFLGTVAFGGNHTDGTEGNISYAAAITARASGDFNSKSDMPTDLIFTTGVSGTDKSGESAGQSNVGTERMRILSSGGITFNGDTASANALDDYEEGSWTPTLAALNNASHGTVHYATYTKIGRQVTIRISFTISSSVSDTSGVGFNLPFTPTSNERVVMAAISDRSGTNKAPFAMINVNQTQYMYAKTLEGYGFQSYNTFSGNYIVCTGTYESA